MDYTENQNLYNKLTDSNKNDGKVYDQTNIIYKYTNNTWTSRCYLLVNYIYLSEDERTRFAQTSHEYLITQTQRIFKQGINTGKNYIDLKTLNHPVKEFIWVLQDPDVERAMTE